MTNSTVVDSISANSHIPIEVSARHVHLSQADLDVLFGAGYQMKSYRELSQPGQFASEEMVELMTARGVIAHVRIVGPVREHTQVELAWTDAMKLGVRPPVRLSGDLRDAAVVTIRGPRGAVENRACAIVAQRHIHLNAAQAEGLGVKHGTEVSVRVRGVGNGELRETTFHHVAVRVHEQFDLRLHLDTDEGNACGAGFEGGVQSVQAVIIQ